MRSPTLLLRRTLATRPIRVHHHHHHHQFTAIRSLTNTPPSPAFTLPITAHGPPPSAPTPTKSAITELRLKQKAAVQAAGQRFWKEAHVITNPSNSSTFHIHLDKRALKTPQHMPLAIPNTKPLLAAGIAMEWNALRKSSDASRGHLVPLTQLAGRAIDMTEQTREEIVANLIRYIDTDTLLVLAPRAGTQQRLRELQDVAVAPILAWLVARFGWPTIQVVDGDHGLIGGGGGGGRQNDNVREALKAWMRGLGAWELVGFERTVLATKSFLIGARLVGEWGTTAIGERRWGVEDAALAASVEVRFQTEMWGEVEDTHDVEKEDLRRQVGAGWLLIADM